MGMGDTHLPFERNTNLLLRSSHSNLKLMARFGSLPMQILSMSRNTSTWRVYNPPSFKLLADLSHCAANFLACTEIVDALVA